METYLCSANFKVYADRFEALESEQKECIAKARETLQTFIRLNDRRSECSSSFHSERRQDTISSKDACSASVRTGKSSKASNSNRSIHEERLLKVVKVAELKTQLSFHAAQAKLKEKRASLEEEERRLALECQIATLESGVKASVEAEQMEENNRSDHLSTIPSKSSKDKHNIIIASIDNNFVIESVESPQSEPENIEFPSKIQEINVSSNTWPESYSKIVNADNNKVCFSTDNQLMNKFDKTLQISQPIISYQLPTIKIEPFDGTVIKYPSWEIAFNALIERNVYSTELKLNLLSQHLTGEAKSLVGGLLTNHTETAYLTARARLKDRYGNPSLVSEAFLDLLGDWPAIKPNQPRELQRYSDMLVQISEFRKGFKGSLQILDFPQETKKILGKLPNYFEREWRENVCRWREKLGEASYPPFDYLVEFIEHRSKKANIPELQTVTRGFLPSKASMMQPLNKRVKAFSSHIESKAQVDIKAEQQRKVCGYCMEEHSINNCNSFLSLNRDTAFKFLAQEHLCFGCENTNEHVAIDCKVRAVCAKCNKRHLTALHQEKSSEKADSKCTEICNGKIDACDDSMILPVWLRNKNNPDKEILSYCILDNQFNACFVTDSLSKQLDVRGAEINLTLSTLYKSKAVTACEKLNNLEVLSFDRSCIELPSVYTRECIPANKSQIPKPEVARK